jgi:GDP-D-mannose dehydratase
MLELMLNVVGIDPEVQVVSQDGRDLEPKVLVGNPSKLRMATGWIPATPLSDSARDLVFDWIERLQT